MQKYEENVLGTTQGVARPLKNVSVTVIDIASNAPASLFSDNGVTPLAQPVVTDENGYFGFYAADGKYRLTFSGSRITTFTRDIILEDPNDNPYATKSELAALSGATMIGYQRPYDGAFRTVAQAIDEATAANSAMILGTVLAGLSTATNAAITAADTILGALGKLQKQLTDWMAKKDATGGYAGLTAFAINTKNTGGTVTSTITNAATVARVYTMPDKDITVAGLADIAITKYAQTADQTITLAGGLTIAHGLGVAPKVVLGFIKCTVAELGYSVGDIIPMSLGTSLDNAAGRGATVTWDATNLNVRFGSGAFTIINKSNGALASPSLTTAWVFILRVLA
jgi:hypothetical protein